MARCDKCGGWDKHKILCADGPGRVTDPKEAERCKANVSISTPQSPIVHSESASWPLAKVDPWKSAAALDEAMERAALNLRTREFSDGIERLCEQWSHGAKVTIRKADQPDGTPWPPAFGVTYNAIETATTATINGQRTPIEAWMVGKPIVEVKMREGDSARVRMSTNGKPSVEVMHEGPDPEAASRIPTSRPIGGTVWAGSFAVSTDPRCTCPPGSVYGGAFHWNGCGLLLAEHKQAMQNAPMPTNTDLPMRPTPAITTRINYANPPEAQTAQARSWRVEMGMETDATEAERLLLAMVENMGSPWRENIGSRTLCAVCHCDEIAGHRGECAWEVARKYLAARGLLKADGA